MTVLRRHRIDVRLHRSIVLQALDQILYLFRCTTHFNLDAARVFSDPASKQKLLGQTPDKRPEANALHDTAEPDALADVV